MASTYITRTVSSAGNQKTWTFSFWFKRTSNVINGDAYIFSYAQGSGQARGAIDIDATNQNFLVQFNPTGSAWTTHTVTSRKIRDVSAWYHIVVKCDTTQATDSNRLKVYINGENQTLDSYPAQNFDTGFNASYQHTLGRYEDADSSYLDGLLTHIHWTDGYAYDASDFGESDSTSGIWKPKASPTGITYGTNGFFLKFENSGAMGTDSSGESNNFTVSGTLTQNVDTPSNNFATLNPLTFQFASQFASIANGNTTLTTDSGSDWGTLLSTIGASSGKYYCEAKLQALGSYARPGICDMSVDQQNSSTQWYLGETSSSAQYSYNSATGNLYTNAGDSSYGDSFTTGDIIGIAMDLDNSKLYFSKNGTWQNSGVPTSGSTGTGAVSITADKTYGFGFSGYASTVWYVNFGSGYFSTSIVASAGTAPSEGGIFEYDCPTGYQALCTKGINSF